MKIKTIKARKFSWKSKEFVNVKIDMDSSGKDLKPGDLYVGKRDSIIGWILLTCEYVHENNYVINKESEYPFDTWECHKVIDMEE